MACVPTRLVILMAVLVVMVVMMVPLRVDEAGSRRRRQGKDARQWWREMMIAAAVAAAAVPLRGSRSPGAHRQHLNDNRADYRKYIWRHFNVRNGGHTQALIRTLLC